ncbi:lipid A deacylase LpxR family protein [Acidocella sp. KAb 2-4]|uniref:lipid A deacylase LpxR family protein n=1 Tax=Acidocella sp. KAb 2-4 TaxID=2885158 RepID=UPI001D0718B8|nr:lipid A deacylase LpxR family protein [Acidocella sp. KAb 2-4]MCB5943394.1 lipid A deacylase LpxR family protein [Acidocella sp. KAb 2-4]
MKTFLRSSLIALSPLVLLAPAARAATPPPDPAGILTIQLENDALSIPSTDRLYTSGERLGYVTPTGDVPGFVSGLGRRLFGEGTQRMEIDLQQVIFTPTNTQLYNPNPKDRPYAGELSLRVGLIQDTTETRSLAGVALGVVGPDSLGQSVQNGFHEIIGQTPNRGWHYQLRNEPTLNVYGGRIWREDVGQIGGVDVQVLPQMTGQVGNTEIYAQAGGILRFGQGLDADFGPAVIQPQLSGTDAYTPTQALSWYVFGGVLGRVVAHDMLIQGNDFTSSRGTSLIPLQGDLEFGAAVILGGMRISAVETIETPEFRHSAPAFQYGSVAISTRF